VSVGSTSVRLSNPRLAPVTRWSRGRADSRLTTRGAHSRHDLPDRIGCAETGKRPARAALCMVKLNVIKYRTRGWSNTPFNPVTSTGPADKEDRHLMALRSAIKGFLARFPFLDGQLRRLIWSRIYFPEAELRWLNALPSGNIDIAVDVGAAVGLYTWILSRKSKQVFAFEPGQQHGRYLARLVAGTNVTLVRAAVGATSCTVPIYTPGTDDVARQAATLSVKNPVIQRPGTTSEPVEVVSLDEFFAGKIGRGRAIDLIKLDIEGYELEAFKGARGLLEQYRPLVICEIEKRHNADFGLVFDLLGSVGYRCFIYRGGDFHPFDERDIAPLQTDEAWRYRIGPNFDPIKNTYINNFVFQHPKSKINVSP
jgi:FkbM family methyltransferase